MSCLTPDGVRVGPVRQAEHAAGVEHHGTPTEAEGHGQGDAPGETAGGCHWSDCLPLHTGV